MVKKEQVRVTIPKWIADLKKWSKETHLEIVPLNEKNDNSITTQAIIVIKEVKNDG